MYIKKKSINPDNTVTSTNPNKNLIQSGFRYPDNRKI